jgi:uncharacterized membrane protein YhaH (DUF805 family)
MEFIKNALSLKQEISRITLFLLIILPIITFIAYLFLVSFDHVTFLPVFLTFSVVALYAIIKRAFTVGYLYTFISLIIALISIPYAKTEAIFVFALAAMIFPARSVQAKRKLAFKEKLTQVSEEYDSQRSFKQVIKDTFLTTKGRLNRGSYALASIFLTLVIMTISYVISYFANADELIVLVTTLLLAPFSAAFGYILNIKRLHDLSLSAKQSKVIAILMLVLGFSAAIYFAFRVNDIVQANFNAIDYVGFLALGINFVISLYLLFKQGDLAENEHGKNLLADTNLVTHKRKAHLAALAVFLLYVCVELATVHQIKQEEARVMKCAGEVLRSTDLTNYSQEDVLDLIDKKCS